MDVDVDVEVEAEVVMEMEAEEEVGADEESTSSPLDKSASMFGSEIDVTRLNVGGAAGIERAGSVDDDDDDEEEEEEEVGVDEVNC